MAIQCILILIGTRNIPFLGRNFRMLAHAQSSRAIAHRRDVQLDIAQFEFNRMRHLFAQRSRILKLPSPIG